MDILKIKNEDGTWTSIPAIIGPKGDKGEPGTTGPAGEAGPKGDTGAAGLNGTDGFSPVVTIGTIENGTTITIQDKTHTDVATIYNGKDGAQGLPGEKGADGSIGPQGPAGSNGAPGKDATINGVNTLELVQGENITLSQSGNQMTISAAGGGSSGGGTWHFTNDETKSDLYNAKIVIITHSPMNVSQQDFHMLYSIWSANGSVLGSIPYKQHKVHLFNVNSFSSTQNWWSYDGTAIHFWGMTPTVCYIAYYY